MKVQSIDQLREIYPGPKGRSAVKVFIKISVDEIFMHCAKALVRLGLWNPEAQIPRSTLATTSEMINAQTGRNDPLENQAEMEARHLNEL